MLLLKPYAYLIRTGEKKYRLHMAIVVPDDFDLEEPSISKGNSPGSVLVDYPLVYLPGQLHEGNKEYMKTLKNVQAGDRISVRISTLIDIDELHWIDDPFLFDSNGSTGPIVLGKVVLSTVGAEEEEENRGDPMNKEQESDPEED